MKSRSIMFTPSLSLYITITFCFKYKSGRERLTPSVLQFSMSTQCMYISIITPTLTFDLERESKCGQKKKRRMKTLVVVQQQKKRRDQQSSGIENLVERERERECVCQSWYTILCVLCPHYQSFFTGSVSPPYPNTPKPNISFCIISISLHSTCTLPLFSFFFFHSPKIK